MIFQLDIYFKVSFRKASIVERTGKERERKRERQRERQREREKERERERSGFLSENHSITQRNDAHFVLHFLFW